MPKEAQSCKRFNGYKPCFGDHNCWEDGCKDHIPVGTKILIINLDAMGDVVMTTARLPGLKRKFPDSTIYWITLKIAAPLLQNNPLIDKVLPYDFESLSILQSMEFDYVMCSDKSQRSCAILNLVPGKHKLGFGLDPNGKIIPLNKGAEYNFRLGMDDHFKFRENTRTGQDYLAETFEIDFVNDEYILNLSAQEIANFHEYRQKVKISEDDFVIGFNTGCSELFPNKKMTVEQHQNLIYSFLKYPDVKIALFGGPEDTQRNLQIAAPFGDKVINTPSTDGVRKGIVYENLADVVITGDSFGMHLAIGLKKFVIAWFGLSCWTEIDLYGRGVKLFPEDLFCAPCWKKSCPYNLECIQMIDLDRIINETMNYYNSGAWKEAKNLNQAYLKKDS
ncbi:MAG: hypothetical protein FMNOHCHN_03886 [Ignavibacteriaceae bacterium]|nr:hypothetical protein [Ignavibacteriaceae bacterium]